MSKLQASNPKRSCKSYSMNRLLLHKDCQSSSPNSLKDWPSIQELNNLLPPNQLHRIQCTKGRKNKRHSYCIIQAWLTHEWTHLDERAGTMNQVLQYMCWSNSQQGYSHASILCHQCDWIVRPVLAELNTVHISCQFIAVQVAGSSDTTPSRRSSTSRFSSSIEHIIHQDSCRP